MDDPVVLSYHDCLLRASDLRLLEGRRWLNDSLLSFWFEHLTHDLLLPPLAPSPAPLLFISPEVTQLLKVGDPEELPVFLDPLGALVREYIFLAVNDHSSLVVAGGTHWSLLVYGRQEATWRHYDSQRGANCIAARRLASRLNGYLGAGEASVSETRCTQQDNGYDCGAFVMVFARALAEAALKGEQLGPCLVHPSEATRVRELVRSLVASLTPDTKPH